MVVLRAYKYLLNISKIVFLLLASTQVMPKVFAAESDDKEFAITLKTLVPTLVASPSICELPQGTETCQQQVSLIWEVPKAGNFCLWIKETESQQIQSKPLHCWQQVFNGTHQLKVNSSEAVVFYLTRGPSQQAIATTTFSIVYPLEQRMRAKRRRGFWRLF